MKNLEVAQLLYNIADILELQEIQWKPQAYRKAAQAIELLTEDIATIYKAGKLEEIPSVGKHIAEKIEEIITTGKLKYYDELKKQVKVDIAQLRSIPGLGPKKIKVLYKKLQVHNITDLEKALQAHKVKKLTGFGEKTEQVFQEGIQLLKTRPRRFLWETLNRKY